MELRFPSPAEEHMKEKVILEDINNADLPHALELFENVADAIEKHPEILEDEKVQIHLNALMRRLQELGYDIETETPPSEETQH